MNTASNTPKINAQLTALRTLRAVGSMPVGWNPEQMIPPTANALVRAGLAEIRMTDGVRTIISKPEEQS